MGLNLNTTKKKDYKLQSSLIDEMINLYGIQCKLLLAEKIGKDDLVFGDYSHLKTVPGQSYEITGLPENSEEWDDIGMNFSEFGLVGTENIRLFFSRKTIDKIFIDIDVTKGFGDLLGNLIVLPNNKIMEISDVQFEVPGVNNVYTNNDVKSVYKFTLVTYNVSLVNELVTTEITPSSEVKDVSVDYQELNQYFNELTGEEVAVDTEAEVTVQTDTGVTIIDTSEDGVFGRF